MPEISSSMPRLTVEQRRAALGQFERAKQVLKGGDLDYGLQLLLASCNIDPANLIYRQELRQTQRLRYQNSGHGQRFAAVRSLMTQFRLRRAVLRAKYFEALTQAELILMRNPWDLTTHLVMAHTFESLEWPDHALWTLEQIRPTHPRNPKVNRPLARLYEKRGNFNQAIALWELVRKADPDDVEAQRKAKDLAASATIAKGRYEDAIKGDGPTPLVTQDAVETRENQFPQEKNEAATTNLVETRVSREVAAVLERIKQDVRNANGYLQLAGIYRRAEQLDQARAILQQGLEPTGNNFEILQELIDLEIEPFRFDLAVAEQHLRNNPTDTELQKIKTRLNKEVSMRELDYFRRRADRNPTDTNARFEMGLRLLQVGQIDEAIKELQAIRNDPRFHARSLFYLGFCFKARKNWRLAQRNLEEALQHFSDKDVSLRKEALFVLAVGFAEIEDYQRALELGSDLANLDYNFKNIGRLLEEWQSKVAR